MELKFSEMSVDTSLAKEYLNKNKALLELCNDYDGTIKQFDCYGYDGKTFFEKKAVYVQDNVPNIMQIIASSLKKNANLIAQLEYHFRNIPIEVTNAQLNLLIQYMNCNVASEIRSCRNYFYPDYSLLMFGMQIPSVCIHKYLHSTSQATAAICHLLVTLLHDAGSKNCRVFFEPTQVSPTRCHLPTIAPVKDVDSGTFAVISDDADVDSAVDKLISVSKQAPWRLRRILVQESVYEQFKDALSWKCNLKTSGDKPQTSDVLCSKTLTYNDRTFLMDPVELVEENPSIVTVEAYRTTKELISLVQQDKTRYLSLWTNVIAEMNEVTHATKSPVVWVNNVADFRGPAQVSEAVFSYTSLHMSPSIVECDRFTKLCTLSQSWLRLAVESRRDILCSVLDKYILLNNANKQLTEIRNSLLTCTLKSFVDVGKDYVCIGMSRPLGVTCYNESTIFSVECFKSILQGNALFVNSSQLEEEEDYTLLEEAGVPVVLVNSNEKVGNTPVFLWSLGSDTVTRVVWTNSGTIFAN